MYSINGNDISLTRGDSLSMKINIIQDGAAYTPDEGDVIRFAMKHRYTDSDSNVLINKTVPHDTMTLAIEPSDTKDLKMGTTYVYDVQITTADGDVYTFIKGKFTLTEEVL